MSKVNKKYSVLLIGCGSIGYRYYQAILSTNFNIDLYLEDKKKKNINKILKEKNKKINIFLKTNKIKKFDLVIISTTANARYKILNRIVKKFQIKYIIFEKVLCQSLNELEKINSLIKKHKIKSWISAHRSAWKSYKKLKSKLKCDKKQVSMYVNGYNWGLACNSIHYMHLFYYLFEQKKIISSNLIRDKLWFDSKRKKFKDLNGQYKIFFNDGSKLIINDLKTHKRNFIKISYKNKKIYIDEINKNIKINKVKKYFSTENLSSVFINEIKKILSNKNPSLPKLNSSISLHKTFISDFLISYRNFIGDKKIVKIPIT